MKADKSDRAAIHIYKLNVFKNNSEERLHYCTIIEVHSPHYLDEEWLQCLYHDQYEQFRECSNKIALLMDRMNLLLSDFPSP